MSMLSAAVRGHLASASWIRKMFEAGIELKAKHGTENVYDFSLGNPDLPPPPEVGACLRALADDADKPFSFGYMPNAGYPVVRAALAEDLSAEQGVAVTGDDLVLTCGAAGALNCLFKAVLEPGDEVLAPAPYFVEYGFYAANHGGVLTTAKCRPPEFDLDLEAMAAALTPKTRVVLVNSPNNPSGAVYPEATLRGLADLLSAHSAKTGREILLVADEPYRFLAYDGAVVPSILPLYPYSVVVSSFSKNLSLAGERVGYALLNPAMPGKAELLGGLIFANRTLGYVNAPAVGQKLIPACRGASVDVTKYAARRTAMAEVLAAAGYDFAMPKGGFYFFPKVPAHMNGDDVAFVQKLQAERVLAVPGAGFGFPGHFRLTFCVDENVIRRALPGLKAAAC